MIQEEFTEPCEEYYKIFTDKPTKGYKYHSLSPFEFKDTLVSLAQKNTSGNTVLDAGRGNPNFFSTLPRYAFALLMKICTELGNNLSEYSCDIGYIPEKSKKYSISKIFYKKLKKTHDDLQTKKFLRKACEKMQRLSGMKKDDFIHNLVTSTIGCNYPYPPRIQNFLEPILTEFFDKNIYIPKIPLKVKIMPTEGCAMAIIYVFNSLKYNGLVIPGDSIGIITPIFSPYLEIPSLENYKLKQICIKSDPEDNWEIPDEEIEKIGDTNMKAMFLVNPTNPTSLSLSGSSIRKISSVIRKKNPNLIIIEDSVYAPYVQEYNSFFTILPKNTIGVFSMSKYFGVTGWRLGNIIIHNNNIIDNMMLKNSPHDVHSRYKMLNIQPEKIKFIDRILADSRQVAEAHVAGLSTPQQVLMGLFATYDILGNSIDYKNTIFDILHDRIQALLDPIDYPYEYTSLSANYYIVLDITKVSDILYPGKNFGDYIRNHRDPLEFLMDLAKKYGVVLLPAVSFAGPFWSVRVSLANLHIKDYEYIGKDIRSLIDDYYKDFKVWKTEQKTLEQKTSEQKTKYETRNDDLPLKITPGKFSRDVNYQ